MSDARHAGPSVGGSAFGFSWAGMGLGAAVWFATSAFRPLPTPDMPAGQQLQLRYGGLGTALIAGTAAGAVAGAVYARRRAVRD